MESVNARPTIDSAKSATLRMLEEHPEINVLVTFNEWTSLGVGYAIQELEAGDRIRVVAFDSNVISVDMLESGEVDALIVQNPYAMGYIGVESAYKVLNGYASLYIFSFITSCVSVSISFSVIAYPFKTL